MTEVPNYGALVISLDLELYWGVRDVLPSNESYWENLKGEPFAIKAILDLFEEYDMAATWATVGFLFAESNEDLERLKPLILPEYANSALSPYLDSLQSKNDKGPFRAPQLIDLIKQTPKQEIATHTFSHYYCLERGQTAETFAADIDSAIKAAGERSIDIKSIVFPRNQHNPEYDKVLIDRGIVCYRGNQKARMYRFKEDSLARPFYRASRLADTFVNVSGPNTYDWNDVWKDGIADVPASVFLRPVSKAGGVLANLQFRRIEKGLEHAARNNRIFHLWWHPHNFGIKTEENIQLLRRILERFRGLHGEFGMQSLSMADAARIAAEANL
jgi:peptidoglycan/xylan/chitin deacetylase (PgdA/CDA1 family)